MTATKEMRVGAVLVAAAVAMGLACVLGCRSDQGGGGSATVPAIHCDAAGCSVCAPCKACMAKMLGTGKK